MKYAFSLVAVFVFLLGGVSSAWAGECYSDPVMAYAGSGSVKSGVFLRDDACMGTNVLTSLAAGTSVSVIGYTDGWYRVEVNGARGWVGEQFIENRATRIGTSDSYEAHMTAYPSRGPSANPSPSTPPPTETVFTGELAARMLVKLPCPAAARADDPCKAVYYIGADGKRHAFPDSRTYTTWYSDFSQVRVISAERLRHYALGANVTARPGIRMLKFTTDPKVYVVGRGGVLRWLASEAVARQLYGADWNRQVNDLSDAFYANYTFGTDVSTTTDFNPAQESTATPSFD